MNITFVRATLRHMADYIKIAHQVNSRFNIVATNVPDVITEITMSTVYMICIDNQVVGFISYVRWINNSVHISEVQVLPAFQGKGIGSRAMSFILDELKDVKVFDLDTHPESRAQNLYARFRFKKDGEVVENYRYTGEPRIHMVLTRE